MKKEKFLVSSIFVLILFIFTALKPDESCDFSITSVKTEHLYQEIFKEVENAPALDLFQKGFNGYLLLREQNRLKRDIITLIDFRLSSNQKRLWVIDLSQNKLLFHTLVAHGRNSGQEYAKEFSNVPMSFKSSLGFYITGKTYFGKHGLSLYLNGIEKGINHKAKERLIVMHGAQYATEDFIRKNGRLGRSLGCPSIPMKVHKQLINTIKDQSCLFIYYPDANYQKHSTLLRVQS